MSESLLTGLRQSGLGKVGNYGALDQSRPLDQSGGVGGTGGTGSTGSASATSPLSGSAVGLHPLPQADDAQQQQVASLDRLRMAKPNVGQKALNVLGGVLAFPVKLTAAVVGTVGGLAIGGVAKLATVVKEAVFGLSEAKLARNAMHAAFTQTDATSILNKDVLVKTAGGQPGARTAVSDIMEQYRLSLGGDSRISADEMKMYIEMGQRVVEGLKNSPAGTNPVTVAKGGQNFDIKSNLDTTRAISWYLQAKMVVDNGHQAGEAVTREAATLKSGAMIGSDPGNKLFDFLAASDNAYGRCSTHCQERSDSVDTSWLAGTRAFFHGGFAALFSSGVSGQPLQRGIEDFDKKMPSMGGTLLFDKLNGPGGKPEIYMKWESVGMPNSFGFTGKHADDADGFADRMLGRGMALARCIGHSANFVGNADPGAMYRGEKLEKGDAKLLFTHFSDAVHACGLGQKDEASILSEVKTYGAYRMDERLDNLIAQKQQQAQGMPADERSEVLKQIKGLTDVKTELATFCDKMGADLGIARKGGEGHVKVE